MAETESLLKDHITGIIYLLENLGFVINHEKSILTPRQIIEFLGFTVNSILMELKLPGENKSDTGVRHGHSSGTVQTSGEDECNYPGNSNSLPILQTLTECAEGDLGKVSAELRSQSHSPRGSEGGAPVVAGSLSFSNWNG